MQYRWRILATIAQVRKRMPNRLQFAAVWRSCDWSSVCAELMVTYTATSGAHRRREQQHMLLTAWKYTPFSFRSSFRLSSLKYPTTSAKTLLNFDPPANISLDTLAHHIGNNIGATKSDPTHMHRNLHLALLLPFDEDEEIKELNSFRSLKLWGV